MKAKRLFLILATLCFVHGFAQQVDLENISSRTRDTFKKHPLWVSGSASVSGAYARSFENGQAVQNAPFLYFLNGNLNIGLYDWSIPFSYRFTNQGSAFNYQIPFKFNRLSLHPKYKWIQAHIGDASMTLSPYTFNGLQFTGVGLELNPEKFPLKAALMGGRLQQAVEYDGNAQTTPAYERWGYGGKLLYKNDAVEVGAIVFLAKDKLQSLSNPIPSEKKIYPQENAVYSAFGKYKPFYFVEVFGEYAISRLGYVNETPRGYDAYNAGINFLIGKTTIGVRYEQVAPEYRTLGAYYFVNDMENITLNGSGTLWQGRISLSGSIGKQRDNLSGQKVKQSNQWVGSVNLSAKVSEAITLSGSYSNFTMFTNKQVNPFEKLNNPSLYEQPQDSIRYRQVSQNVSANLVYMFSETKQLTLNYNLNDVVNRENDIVRKGGISRFHNVGLNYSWLFPEQKLTLTPSFNYTHNYVAREISQIFGPSIQISKSFLDDKLSTSVGGNYSHSVGVQTRANTANLQLGAAYSPWKSHQFTFSAVQSFRNSKSPSAAQSGQDTNLSIGYTYRLEKTEIPLPKFKFKKKEKTKRTNEDEKREPIEDAKEQAITSQSEEIAVISEEESKPKVEIEELPVVEEIPVVVTESRNGAKEESHKNKREQHRSKRERRVVPEKPIEKLTPEEQLEQDYRMFVFRCLQNLYHQAYRMDERLKTSLFTRKNEWDKDKSAEKEAIFRKAEAAYLTHLWMVEQLQGLTLQDVIEEKGLLKDFSHQHKEDIKETLQKKLTKQEKMNYISILLADFYHKAFE